MYGLVHTGSALSLPPSQAGTHLAARLDQLREGLILGCLQFTPIGGVHVSSKS